VCCAREGLSPADKDTYGGSRFCVSLVLSFSRILEFSNFLHKHLAYRLATLGREKVFGAQAGVLPCVNACVEALEGEEMTCEDMAEVLEEYEEELVCEEM
jgi:hypothetical protein